MDRSAETLALLQTQQPSYAPNATVLKALSRKTLVCAVGPAGIGKSTTLDVVSRLNPSFGRTGSVVTRAPHERDNLQMNERYISIAEATGAIAKGEFVNYIVHPTTHAVYASDLHAYIHDYNMLETLPGSIDYFRTVGFQKVYVLYFVTEPTAWRTWFDERYPHKDDERAKRIREAEQSLVWALGQSPETIIFIYNTPGEQEETAQTIIDVVKYKAQERSDGITYAKGMLQQIKEM